VLATDRGSTLIKVDLKREVADFGTFRAQISRLRSARGHEISKTRGSRSVVRWVGKYRLGCFESEVLSSRTHRRDRPAIPSSNLLKEERHGV